MKGFSANTRGVFEDICKNILGGIGGCGKPLVCNVFRGFFGKILGSKYAAAWVRVRTRLGQSTQLLGQGTHLIWVKVRSCSVAMALLPGFKVGQGKALAHQAL